eukprot:scaffold73094_cov34-Tisochrysis_lutea.AAC.3
MKRAVGWSREKRGGLGHSVPKFARLPRTECAMPPATSSSHAHRQKKLLKLVPHHARGPGRMLPRSHARSPSAFPLPPPALRLVPSRSTYYLGAWGGGVSGYGRRSVPAVLTVLAWPKSL